MAVVDEKIDQGIRIVTLNRPDALNAFSSELMDALAEAFIGAAADANTKVLVLTGAGRAFSAGADLKAMGKPAHTPKYGLSGLLEAIIDFPKPWLIAANGVGVGIGCTLLGLADAAFAAASARFRCPFSALGLTAEAASTVTFARLMGHQQASWFLLSSEWLSADKAMTLGLVHSVYPDDRLMDEVMHRAAVLAALPLTSLVQTKALMTRTRNPELKAAIKLENAALDQLAGGRANREALAAFAAKREPDFTAL